MMTPGAIDVAARERNGPFGAEASKFTGESHLEYVSNDLQPSS
jgi:hypothetical protein